MNNVYNEQLITSGVDGNVYNSISNSTNTVVRSKTISSSKRPAMKVKEKPWATAEEIEPQLKASCRPDWTGPRSCEHFTNTAYGENIELSNVAIHGPNKDGTYDYGICQINSIHKGFFKTSEWRNIDRQIMWCSGMRDDAFRRGIHPSRKVCKNGRCGPWTNYR